MNILTYSRARAEGIAAAACDLDIAVARVNLRFHLSCLGSSYAGCFPSASEPRMLPAMPGFGKRLRRKPRVLGVKRLSVVALV